MLETLRKERTAPGTSEGTRTKSRAEEDTGERRVLACRACRAPITDASQRIEVRGAHEHVQANPGGIVYEVACFRAAPGCIPRGPREAYWSWFPGHVWQIALCRGCGSHVGWSFHAAEGNAPGFHGLIVRRLVELEEEDGTS